MRHDQWRQIQFYHIREPEHKTVMTARWDRGVNNLIIQLEDDEHWYSLMEDMVSTGSLPTGEDWFLWKDGMVTVIPLPVDHIK